MPDFKKYIDQVGRTVNLPLKPQRIISLVPSQTELLFHIGLEDEVIGITKFCIYPDAWFHSKERIGGPKKLNIEKIKALQPDLVIGNKEENVKEEIEAIEKFAPVWLSDVYNLADNYQMISSIGAICNKIKEADKIINDTKSAFEQLTPLETPHSVLYLIWKNPFMAVASNTFIDYILSKELGFTNIIKNKKRYPMLSDSNLPQPDYVFLSTEPYPFKEKHIKELQTYFPNSKLIVVDGEYFTWYGWRLSQAPKYFKNLLINLRNKTS